MKIKIALSMFVFSLIFLASGIVHAQTAPSPSPNPSTEPFEVCMGKALAKYMNAVLAEKSGLNNIRFTSPAFNMTSGVEPLIYKNMVTAGAKFNLLDAWAGNVYSGIADLRSAYQWFVTQGWKTASAGKPVIFTEFGDFRTTGPTTSSAIIADMVADYKEAAADGQVVSINYFNALGTGGSEFNFHAIGAGIFGQVTNGSGKAGINSATWVNSSFGPLASGAGANWAVEILNGPGDVNQAIDAVNGYAGNMVLRLCASGDSCSFADPQALIGMLKTLNAGVHKPVYVIIGPNEPATEKWAGPQCKPTTPPYKLDDEPCEQTVNPEFHSLRPYPTNPCNKNREESYYLCGQDLVVKEKYEFNQAEGSCSTVTAGTGQVVRCDYSVNSTAGVSLGLGAADFPIMGNTEMVPNGENKGSPTLNLPFLLRVNEYVSWYLNGIPFRAEEKNFQMNNSNSTVAGKENINVIVDLAGPLKKLLPKTIQTNERKDEVDAVNALQRHDQIVECGTLTDPQACYSESGNVNRLKAVAQVSEDAPAFPYIPFSSTEDRLGQTKSGLNIGEGSCNGFTNDPAKLGVVCADFELKNDARNLYFAHIDEDNKLGELLQNTFKPIGKSDESPITQPIIDSQLGQQNSTAYCELLESRRNPGDRLYGELNKTGDNPDKISGTLTYTANFQCDFPVQTADEIAKCVTDCGTDTVCQDKCVNPENKCQREVFIPFSVKNFVPDIKTAWEKFVAGSMSIVKRIFPQVGKETPIDEIKDIPGESHANYQSNNTGVSGNGSLISSEALAGNPAENRSGATAKLFFPHIGSIYDYFLKDIQLALRPQGITDNTEFNLGGNNPGEGGNVIPGEFPGIACPAPRSLPSPGTGAACNPINCDMTVPDSAVPAKYMALKNNFIRIGDSWVANDTNEVETAPDGQKHKSHAAHCFNDVVVRSLAAGINPVFSLAIWAHESAASDYIKGNIIACDPNSPTTNTQDFGINKPSMAGNFDAQIKRFLQLPYDYPNNYSQCFPNKICNMEYFSRVYKYGANADCSVTQGALDYANNTIRRWMGNIAPGCGSKIIYPTDMSCP